jgi:hypothetical protein
MYVSAEVDRSKSRTHIEHMGTLGKVIVYAGLWKNASSNMTGLSKTTSVPEPNLPENSSEPCELLQKFVFFLFILLLLSEKKKRRFSITVVMLPRS